MDLGRGYRICAWNGVFTCLGFGISVGGGGGLMLFWLLVLACNVLRNAGMHSR